MDKIRFLLKFGKKKDIERLQQGYLYFSNAEKFRETEEKLFIKGQGDINEASSIIGAEEVAVTDNSNDRVALVARNVTIRTHYPDADNIPVFCLFACSDKDCFLNMDGSYTICLSEDIRQTIKEHFPNADTVAIISYPEKFISDIDKSVGTRCIGDKVHYFDMYPKKSNAGVPINEKEYFMYLTQDTPPVRTEKGTQYIFCIEYIYRVLQCKDTFFEQEQEYRFILPDMKIEMPQEFYVSFDSGNIRLQNLDSFFSEMAEKEGELK